jgi:hypothetical protein
LTRIPPFPLSFSPLPFPSRSHDVRVTALLDRLILAAADRVLRRRHRALVRNFRKRYGRWPGLGHPVRYADRMLWRKILDRNPLFVVFTDKLACKDHMARLCPGLALPRTLWTGTDADDIPDAVLAGDVLVKASHGWNMNLRIRGGVPGRTVLKQTTEQWLRTVHGQKGGEWSYSQVAPRLFVEETVGDSAASLLEFNIRASNGRIILGSVLGLCKSPDEWRFFLDPAGEPVSWKSKGKPDPVPEILPHPDEQWKIAYLEAVRHTEQLSRGVDYARFDFLWDGGPLYGGEITVYPRAGHTTPAGSPLDDAIMAGWDLRVSHFLTAPQHGWARLYAGALRRALEAAGGRGESGK